eukprot:1138173-Pelagomonas_calceolata.AAC.4
MQFLVSHTRDCKYTHTQDSSNAVQNCRGRRQTSKAECISNQRGRLQRQHTYHKAEVDCRGSKLIKPKQRRTAEAANLSNQSRAGLQRRTAEAEHISNQSRGGLQMRTAEAAHISNESRGRMQRQHTHTHIHTPNQRLTVKTGCRGRLQAGPLSNQKKLFHKWTHRNQDSSNRIYGNKMTRSLKSLSTFKRIAGRGISAKFVTDGREQSVARAYPFGSRVLKDAVGK